MSKLFRLKFKMAEEAAKADLPPVEDAGLRDELTKLEDEINTLKQVQKAVV